MKTNRIKKRFFWSVFGSIFITSFLILCFHNLSAQDNPRPYPIDIIPASPNAASIQQYGEVPVSLFNGLPNISIPLMEVSDRGLTLPISLSYHASGINPDQHPGWVGLGWSLQAGGVITRIVNGGVDEAVQVGSGPSFDSLKYAYYDHYDLIDREDWESLESLARYNYTTVVPDLAIPSPDEFRFNFMGYSGSFFLNHKGEWKVKSKQNIALTIEVEEPGPLTVTTIDENAQEYRNLVRTFRRFTIISEDGTRYTFGGSANNIEFTQLLGNDDPEYNSGVVSKSWYLTRIQTINGREINLEYKSGHWQAELAIVSQLYDRSGSSNIGDNISRSSNPWVGTANLINPVYLTKIITPNSEVHFQTTPAVQLSYEFDQFDPNFLQFLPELIRSQGGPLWYKLDRIELFQKGDTIARKYVILEYNDDASERLMLEKVQIMSAETGESPYLFTYNNTALPEYNSLQQDHWGYYNGVNYFEQNAPPYDTASIGEDYYQSRQPDDSLMKAGILHQITYPTGGITTFEYEPHDYSFVATKYPFSLAPVSGNPNTAGGLRIAKITSSSGNEYPDVVKTYHYVQNFQEGGTLSSGILSDSAKYETRFEDGTITNWELTSVPVEPFLNTDGNHITYSEVTEVLADSSFTIYKYANHDNPAYRDEDANAVYVANDDRRWRYDPFTSKELERGQLLSKVMLDANQNKVREELYTYNNDPNRFDSHIRVIDTKYRSFYIGNSQILNLVFDNRITAYQIYHYTPYLTSKTEKIYDQQDTSRFVETLYAYEYSNPEHNQLTRTEVTDSEGRTRITHLSYAPDFSNNEYNSDTLISRHVYTPALLQVDSLNDEKTFQLERFLNLSSNNIAHIVLDSTLTFPMGADSNPIKVIYQYDSAGNINQVQKEDDMTTAFVWGYNYTRPVAQVVGATATQAEAVINLTALQTLDGQALRDELDNLHSLPNTLVTTYTYDPIYGMTSTVDPSGVTRYFEYDGLGRLKLTRDHQSRIEQSFFYRYQK